MMEIEVIVVFFYVFLNYFMGIGVFFFIVAKIVIVVALIIPKLSPALHYIPLCKFWPFQDQAGNRSS